MADFIKSYEKTSKFEGGYANHKNDKGGETYKGIARKMHPNWVGWKIVDRYKTSSLTFAQLDKVLKGNGQIQEMVELFYRANFWDKIMGDSISKQEIADNIYDFAVNSGVSRAVKYAQRVVKTEEDGIIGIKTIRAINSKEDNFIDEYKSSRLEFFKRIVINNPSQNVFMKGWTSRVENV